MKHILVPTDFSENAQNAIDFAVQSAKMLPVKITLMHSFIVKDNMYTDYMGLDKEFSQTMLHDMQLQLNELKKQIEDKDGIIVETELSHLALHDAIEEAIDEKKADLIVMGTLGRSGIAEKLWGSETASLLDTCRVPVMVIPHEFKWKKPQKILMATNHFEKDDNMLNFLFELADLYMAQVQVTVFTDEDDDKADSYLEHSRSIERFGRMLKDKYNEKTITMSQLYGKAFEETLQDYIKGNEIDILVMVNYQRSFWDRLFHPSKTKRMSYHTHIPLLVFPAKKQG